MAAQSLSRAEARIEINLLAQRWLNVSHAWLLAHPEQIIPAAQQAEWADWLQRRLNGEPLAYLLGEREFFGLTFQVTPATLIPRADTELLVELALQKIPPGAPWRVLDLGTGSGAVALALAHARPEAAVWALDASQAALAVARENAARLGLKRVNFLHSDWFSALGEARFELIVSNPPYIAEADPHLQQGDLRFEPVSALAAGADGLDDIRQLIAAAPRHLLPGGGLWLEHGYDQAAAVRALLARAGFSGIASARDLAGIERVTGGFFPGTADD